MIYVKVIGNGLNVPSRFQAKSHEVKGYPAGTYHLFIMENGAKFWLNDFGIRSVTTADDPKDLD